MQDKELYHQLLGLKGGWEVTGVGIDFNEKKVDVRVEWSEAKGRCPECGYRRQIYDIREERKWRHLDTMQYETVIHCRIPRVTCQRDGVKSMSVPWAEAHSRFTILFERLAIEVLLGSSDQTKAKELLRLSWDEVHRIQERGVDRGLERRTAEMIGYMGVDEKSFGKGIEYVTVVSDIEGGRVWDVAKDRKESSLKEILDKMDSKQKEKVDAVAMDMWDPYIRCVEEQMSGSTIVHDKFHISKYMNKAVDKVRKKENQQFVTEGKELLKGTKYLWLKKPENWTHHQSDTYQQLKGLHLKVGRAWGMKETFVEFWKYQYAKPAEKFFNRWYGWATHSRLQPMIDVAKMLKRRFDKIVTYFRHRITNAVAEGLNSKIQQIKSAARGFRNFVNYRIAILFHCGKLDMLPHSSQ